MLKALLDPLMSFKMMTGGGCWVEEWEEGGFVEVKQEALSLSCDMSDMRSPRVGWDMYGFAETSSERVVRTGY